MYSIFCLIFAFLLSCDPNKPSTDTVREPEPQLSFESCSQNIGDHPCNFTLKDQNGETVELYDFYGKVIIVDFSVMWCAPCLSMAKAADPVVLDYGSQNVEWLTVIIEDESGQPPDQSDLQRWSSAAGITGHVLGSDRSIIDQTAITGYPITGWPTFVVIDQDMVLKHAVRGWSEPLLRQLLDSLIVSE